MSDKHPKKIPRVQHLDGARPDTLAVREGLPRTQWGENSEALFMTSSFVQPDAATAAARFANEEEAFTYSRFTNPTVTMMERRLAALEGVSGCVATSSGMAAIMLLVMGLLNPAIQGFEASCFDGQYITGDVSVADFQAMQDQRTAARKDDDDSPDRSRLTLQSRDDAT